MTEILQHEFMRNAIFVALLVGLCNGYVSTYVVLNKSALIMNALSHSLLPGIAVTALLFSTLTPINAFFGALSSAIFISLFTYLIAKNNSIDKSTIFAILYTFSFAIGIFIIQYFPVHVNLEDWLFGNILGVTDFDIHICFVTTVLVILVLMIFQRPLIITLFESSVAKSQGINTAGLNILLISILAITLISTIQAVGCTLAIGLMATPGAIAHLFTNSPEKNILISSLLGVIISLVSITISYYLDAPPGALIIVIAGSLFLLALIIKKTTNFIERRSSAIHHI